MWPCKIRAFRAVFLILITFLVTFFFYFLGNPDVKESWKVANVKGAILPIENSARELEKVKRPELNQEKILVPEKLTRKNKKKQLENLSHKKIQYFDKLARIAGKEKPGKLKKKKILPPINQNHEEKPACRQPKLDPFNPVRIAVRFSLNVYQVLFSSS